MEIQFLPISWNEYHDLARKLAASILQHTPDVNQIVAISRGGLTLGHLLTDFLRIPIATIAIQSYSDIQKQGELKITQPLNMHIRGKHILLVDDVADTGKTFKRAATYLKSFKPKEITTVAIFYKPKSIFRPDYFAKTTTKWIIFPYEITETILAITQSMDKEGKTKAQIQKKLESLNFTDEQIRFARKYHLG